MASTCNHVAAVLLKVNDTWTSGDNFKSVTSMPNTWKDASKKIAEPARVSDMLLVKHKFSRGPDKGDTLNHAKKRLFAPHDTSKGMSEQEFIQELEQLSPDSVCLAERKPTRIPSNLNYDKLHADTRLQEIPPSIHELASQSETPEELRCKIDNINFSHLEVQQIEQATRIQKSQIWFEQRKGRLTASNFHRASTRLKTFIKTKCDTSSATSDILGYTQPPKEKTSYGIKTEDTAAQQYQQLLIDNGHKNVKVNHCGLFVGKSEPYMGATPDRIVSCDCCPNRVLEIKCPMVGVTEQLSVHNVKFLTEKDGNLVLKDTHAYYTQVQGQMYFTGLTNADFFVYCEYGNSHLERITFDRPFWFNVLGDLKLYYYAFVVPELISEKIKNKIKSDTATQTCHSKSEFTTIKAKGASKPNSRKGKSRKQATFKPVYMCGKCNKRCIDIDKDTTDSAENSIYCDTCHAWFHWLCVGIHDLFDDAFEEDTYMCPGCIQHELNDAMDTN